MPSPNFNLSCVAPIKAEQLNCARGKCNNTCVLRRSFICRLCGDVLLECLMQVKEAGIISQKKFSTSFSPNT